MGKRLEIREGDRFGRLSVISEEASKRKPSGQIYRVFRMVCDCGKIASVRLGGLRSGHTTSCGCLSLERATSHGKSKERIYKCWENMKSRSNRRDSCKVHPSWESFPSFEDWSIRNGYEDTLVLCRNGDKGDYSPENCRWDTQGNNVIESLGKEYVVTYPESKKTVIIKGLSKFCRENNLHMSAILLVMSGKRSHHKGFVIKRLEG